MQMGKAGALEGLRIADLSHVLAAPTASMILADLGAEVIHIEPPFGDDARQFGPFIQGQSAYFISINRNKKSLVIDLKQDQGKTILRDLIGLCDVVLENFKPGTMKNLGFSYENCREINPKIIYASISGFGHDTPPEYANKPAYDMIAQAYSGVMSICGPEGGPPVRVGTSSPDINAQSRYSPPSVTATGPGKDNGSTNPWSMACCTSWRMRWSAIPWGQRSPSLWARCTLRSPPFKPSRPKTAGSSSPWATIRYGGASAPPYGCRSSSRMNGSNRTCCELGTGTN